MNFDFLDEHKIVPVVVIEKIEDAVPKLSALKEGGINIAEITFRTSCAEEAIKLALSSEKTNSMIIGAGTVINKEQCERAIKAGVKFIVSPGFSEQVFEVCKKNDVPYLPGVCTPTEIMAALNCGLTILKFFPASVFGGIKTLKTYASVFPQVSFMPTGGINEENMNEFLGAKFVKAIGGSWMMKGSVDDIKNLSKKAVNQLNSLKATSITSST